MNVYVFGNEDTKIDNVAIKVATELKGKINDVKFIFIKPNEELPPFGQKVVILDGIDNTNEIKILEGLDKILLSPKVSAHDYDLSFQLKYLQKLGKLGEVIVIGLPLTGKIDYELLQSIFKKLVAQDIQGS